MASTAGNRVEWRVTGVAEKLSVMQKGQSIYSDAFDCMGLRGLPGTRVGTVGCQIAMQELPKLEGWDTSQLS